MYSTVASDVPNSFLFFPLTLPLPQFTQQDLLSLNCVRLARNGPFVTVNKPLQSRSRWSLVRDVC